MELWQTPSPVRAAFFDADGTLLSFATHEVPASSCEALRALRRAGVRCFLCTGRSPSLLDDIPLELFDACLTMSGQYCYAADDVFLSNPIDREDMRQVVVQVREGRYEVLFMEPADSFLSGHSILADRALEAANMMHVRVEPAERALDRDIYQLNVFLPPEDMAVIESVVHNMKFTRWSPNFADAMPANGGKAAGVEAALARYGITPEEAIAFGDGGNDAEMFGAVRTSIAMGNAAAAVKELTTYVTDGVDDDGIYNACIRLGLM